MAKNWTLTEGYKAIKLNNMEAIQDLGRRFPLTTHLISTMNSSTEVAMLFEAMPIHLTVRKIEAFLKEKYADGSGTTEEAEEDTAEEIDEDEEEEPAPKKKAKPEAPQKKAKPAEAVEAD